MKTNCTFWLRTLCLVVLLSWAGTPPIWAQTDLFTEGSWAIDELEGEELENYLKLTQTFNEDQISAIDLFPLEEAQENGKLLVSVPWINCASVIYHSRIVQYVSPESYSWSGLILGEEEACECESGYLILRNEAGRRNGVFSIDDESFQIVALSPEKNVLIHPSGEEEPSATCGTEESDIPGLQSYLPDLSAMAESRSSGLCDVGILLVYTDEYDQITTDVNASANIFIDYLNLALRNSDVPAYNISFELSGLEKVTFDENQKMLIDGLNFCLFDPDVQNFRDNIYHADLVYLMVRSSLLDPAETAGGLAYTIAGPNPTPSSISVAAGTGHWNRASTFSHEIGHLMGCGHLHTNTSTQHDHAHDFEYKNWCFGKKHRATTIMYDTFFRDSRIPYFSNPDVEYKNQDTGVPGFADNADVILSNACTVANYRTAPLPFTVRIQGDPKICIFDTKTLIADPHNASGPYTYEWYVNSTGIAPWGSVQSTSNTLFVSAVGYNVGDVIHVKLEATAGNGQTATYWHSLLVVQSSSYQILCTRAPELEELPTVKRALTLIPNPASDWLEVRFEGTETPETLTLFNGSGQLVRQFGAIDPLSGRNQRSLDLNGLPNGIYFLQAMSDSGGIIVEKLIIHQ